MSADSKIKKLQAFVMPFNLVRHTYFCTSYYKWNSTLVEVCEYFGFGLCLSL